MLYAALQQKMGEKKPPGGGLNGASGLSLSADLTHIPAHTDERIDQKGLYVTRIGTCIIYFAFEYPVKHSFKFC
jgi:hypothetical protein